KSHASSVAVIPIFHKQNTYGNMVFGYRKPYSFSAEDQTLAVALGNTAAQVLTIQKLLNQKDEFMGIVSHELRTPLTTVKGFTQLLQHRLIGTDKNNQYFLAKINSQIDRLSRLVRDLLEVSKIDSGKMTFNKTKIDLNELVKDITEDLQFTTDQHKLVLSGKVPGLVLADYDRLSQVLINIIMNAIKYSPRQKRVLIKLKKVDDNAVIMVQDFGIGISPQYQKKIFERFFQGNKIGPTAFPGLGLGLFISREIILRHQGNIWCVSRRGRGSKFFITLPIKNHNVQ
ncbi:MAG TPA: ATP-binding protein, partial [Methylomirabilota bacterium]|nr:ATP-binding protein [Methylomirabilota bacterium]